MPNQAKVPAPPSDDKRWRIVTATMRRHGFRSDALIETLHSVQEAFGYIDDDALRFVARGLHVPPSRVYGVATFYNYFTLKPQGEHTCVVCLGTACYIKGAANILRALENHLELKAGETTSDKQVSLLTARCMGACGLAPIVVNDGEVAAQTSPEAAVAVVEEWMNHAIG
ncbi:MAG: bidirectional hydrogenase complex protein HoxE [Anaerolineae bacterium]